MIRIELTVILSKGLSLILNYIDLTASVLEMIPNFLKPLKNLK